MAGKVKVKKSASAPRIKQTRRGRSSTSRISTKNQVTIPVDTLRTIGLKAGDEVEFAVNDAGFITVTKSESLNPFEKLSRAAGDIYLGFDLQSERGAQWE